MNLWGLASPWMLLALPAVAAPILIHYLTRARPRPIKYPPYHLLVEAASGKQALHRLQLWILLALRCAAVLALVLLFGLPFLRRGDSEGAGTPARRVVLLVDASMSMGGVSGGIPLFAKAKAEAAEVLNCLPPGSVAGLIFLAARPKPALPGLSRNLPALHETLVKAEPTMELGRPGPALALAGRMLGGSGSIYVFSDFQRTNWSSARIQDIQGASFILRPATQKSIEHVAITSVQISPADPVSGETIEISCTVFNASSGARREALSLQIEGILQTTEILLRPYSSSHAVFTLSLDAEGCFPGHLSLSPDDLSEDNTRYFLVQVRKALEVLIVSDADPSDHSSAAFFVGTAIAPSEAAASGLKLVRRHSQDTNRSALDSADILVVVTPAALTEQVAEGIVRRLTEGAHLICMLDGPTSPMILTALASVSEETVTPPFQLLQPAVSRSEKGEPFGKAKLSSSLLKMFSDKEQGDLSSLYFLRHYLTRVHASREEEILITFGDGSAALSFSPAGRGTAIFTNFSVAPEGGNLVGSPLFPALLAELIRGLRRTAEERAATPGQPWEIDVPEAGGVSGQSNFQVLGPNGKELDSSVVARGRTVRLGVSEARLPGLYRVQQGGALAALGVVNVDPLESDTRQLPLATVFESAAGRVMVVDEEGDLVTAGQPRPLWPWLAACACVCLGLEMLLLSLWRRPRRL